MGYFGIGIVKIISNFGSFGDCFFYFEFFDWFVVNFMSNGWLFKWLYCEIMFSLVY